MNCKSIEGNWIHHCSGSFKPWCLRVLMRGKEECLSSWPCSYRAAGHSLWADIDSKSPSLWNSLQKEGENSILYCVFVKICMLNRVAKFTSWIIPTCCWAWLYISLALTLFSFVCFFFTCSLLSIVRSFQISINTYCKSVSFDFSIGTSTAVENSNSSFSFTWDSFY